MIATPHVSLRSFSSQPQQSSSQPPLLNSRQHQQHFIPMGAFRHDSSTQLKPQQQLVMRRRNVRGGPATNVDSLPAEMLVRIFELGSHPDLPDPDVGNTDDDGSRFEIKISHVCKRWRKLALGTSKLWTSIVFREMSHLDRARVYLDRSIKASTIDVFVDTVSAETHVKGVTLCREEFDAVFNLVTPHVARWRSLILKVRDIECKTGARKHLSTCGPAPRLETLQLYHLENWQSAQQLYNATIRTPVTIFEGVLPSLKEVFLIGVNLQWGPSHFLSGLENLELSCHRPAVRPTYGEWQRILTSCPDLRRLAVHYSGPTEHDPWPTDPICLPKLYELSLCDLDPCYLTKLFAHLSLPNVKRLRLDLPEQDAEDQQPAQDYTAFFNAASRTKAFRHLESLHVTTLDCSFLAWTDFLESIPQLRFLYIDFRRVDHVFLIPLTEDQHPCSPKLRILKVSGLSVAQLSSFAASRAIHHHPLDCIYVNARDPLTERDSLTVEQLRLIKCPVRWYIDPDELDAEEEAEGEDEEEEEEEGDDDDDDASSTSTYEATAEDILGELGEDEFYP